MKFRLVLVWWDGRWFRRETTAGKDDGANACGTTPVYKTLGVFYMMDLKEDPDDLFFLFPLGDLHISMMVLKCCPVKSEAQEMIQRHLIRGKSSWI